MSWSDPCSNCGNHRADCDCGNWNNYKDKETHDVSNVEEDIVDVYADLEDFALESRMAVLNDVFSPEFSEEDIKNIKFGYKLGWMGRNSKIKNVSNVEKYDDIDDYLQKQPVISVSNVDSEEVEKAAKKAVEDYWGKDDSRAYDEDYINLWKQGVEWQKKQILK